VISAASCRSGEPLLEVDDAVAGQRRYHERRGKRGARARVLDQRQQRRLLDQIDLVDDEDFPLPRSGKPLQQRSRVGIKSVPGIDEHADEVGVAGAAPGPRHHGALQPAAGREDSGCVDEDELSLSDRGDAA